MGKRDNVLSVLIKNCKKKKKKKMSTEHLELVEQFTVARRIRSTRPSVFIC